MPPTSLSTTDTLQALLVGPGWMPVEAGLRDEKGR
jgi:hypothetical protein